MGWKCKHTTQAARTHGARKGKGGFRRILRGGGSGGVHVRSRCGALRLRLVMRHTVIARLGLRVSLRAGLSGLYRAGKAHIYLHAD